MAGQMEKEAGPGNDVETYSDSVEVVLFQVKECYVYKIPPRRSAASYRADEWDINKWAWEGALKVVSKGTSCTVRLEDNKTDELFAQASVLAGHPSPVEAVIDSSRFFVLRVEDASGGASRHAFIGIGFRERSQAYDFQAALYDHNKFVNRLKEAEEMEHQYESKPSANYSLKEGETMRIDLKALGGSGSFFRPKQTPPSPTTPGALQGGRHVRRVSGEIPASMIPSLPPPPQSHALHSSLPQPHAEKDGSTKQTSLSTIDDDFGDFQAAA
eukprot:TRINITY_DN16895_c0_g1_i1.p1 TRINITY_DN16895_c0_g1~~TRINITY_DN16895_c0_g1_i1.p1  ORF type:complete len:271 (-),score=42.14 TRINITY_DN16895_c0_g1_i1:242-1054(-)